MGLLVAGKPGSRGCLSELHLETNIAARIRLAPPDFRQALLSQNTPCRQRAGSFLGMSAESLHQVTSVSSSSSGEGRRSSGQLLPLP